MNFIALEIEPTNIKKCLGFMAMGNMDSHCYQVSSSFSISHYSSPPLPPPLYSSPPLPLPLYSSLLPFPFILSPPAFTLLPSLCCLSLSLSLSLSLISFFPSLFPSFSYYFLLLSLPPSATCPLLNFSPLPPPYHVMPSYPPSPFTSLPLFSLSPVL